MTKDRERQDAVFPPWTNYLRPAIAVMVVGGAVYATVIVAYGFSPDTTDVGYQPEQPVSYSHQLHVGQLGMDCRYCHTGVETTAHASIPPTQTCMNCHKMVRAESPALTPVFESYATGMPIEWIRVHDLPDYVYFDHSAHVTRGVPCIACHGRVDTMEVVYQHESLSMGWCLDCHRDPARHLRPPEHVTSMDWQPEGDPVELGRRLMDEGGIYPSTDCTTCHR